VEYELFCGVSKEVGKKMPLHKKEKPSKAIGAETATTRRTRLFPDAPKRAEKVRTTTTTAASSTVAGIIEKVEERVYRKENTQWSRKAEYDENSKPAMKSFEEMDRGFTEPSETPFRVSVPRVDPPTKQDISEYREWAKDPQRGNVQNRYTKELVEQVISDAASSAKEFNASVANLWELLHALDASEEQLQLVKNHVLALELVQREWSKSFDRFLPQNRDTARLMRDLLPRLYDKNGRRKREASGFFKAMDRADPKSPMAAFRKTVEYYQSGESNYNEHTHMLVLETFSESLLDTVQTIMRQAALKSSREGKGASQRVVDLLFPVSVNKETKKETPQNASNFYGALHFGRRSALAALDVINDFEGKEEEEDGKLSVAETIVVDTLAQSLMFGEHLEEEMQQQQQQKASSFLDKEKLERLSDPDKVTLKEVLDELKQYFKVTVETTYFDEEQETVVTTPETSASEYRHSDTKFLLDAFDQVCEILLAEEAKSRRQRSSRTTPIQQQQQQQQRRERKSKRDNNDEMFLEEAMRFVEQLANGQKQKKVDTFIGTNGRQRAASPRRRGRTRSPARKRVIRPTPSRAARTGEVEETVAEAQQKYDNYQARAEDIADTWSLAGFLKYVAAALLFVLVARAAFLAPHVSERGLSVADTINGTRVGVSDPLTLVERFEESDEDKAKRLGETVILNQTGHLGENPLTSIKNSGNEISARAHANAVRVVEREKVVQTVGDRVYRSVEEMKQSPRYKQSQLGKADAQLAEADEEAVDDDEYLDLLLSSSGGVEKEQDPRFDVVMKQLTFTSELFTSGLHARVPARGNEHRLLFESAVRRALREAASKLRPTSDQELFEELTREVFAKRFNDFGVTLRPSDIANYNLIQREVAKQISEATFPQRDEESPTSIAARRVQAKKDVLMENVFLMDFARGRFVDDLKEYVKALSELWDAIEKVDEATLFKVNLMSLILGVEPAEIVNWASERLDKEFDRFLDKLSESDNPDEISDQLACVDYLAFGKWAEVRFRRDHSYIYSVAKRIMSFQNAMQGGVQAAFSLFPGGEGLGRVAGDVVGNVFGVLPSEPMRAFASMFVPGVRGIDHYFRVGTGAGYNFLHAASLWVLQSVFRHAFFKAVSFAFSGMVHFLPRVAADRLARWIESSNEESQRRRLRESEDLKTLQKKSSGRLAGAKMLAATTAFNLVSYVKSGIGDAAFPKTHQDKIAQSNSMGMLDWFFVFNLVTPALKAVSSLLSESLTTTTTTTMPSQPGVLVGIFTLLGAENATWVIPTTDTITWLAVSSAVWIGARWVKPDAVKTLRRTLSSLTAYASTIGYRMSSSATLLLMGELGLALRPLDPRESRASLPSTEEILDLRVRWRVLQAILGTVLQGLFFALYLNPEFVGLPSWQPRALTGPEMSKKLEFGAEDLWTQVSRVFFGTDARNRHQCALRVANMSRDINLQNVEALSATGVSGRQMFQEVKHLWASVGEFISLEDITSQLDPRDPLYGTQRKLASMLFEDSPENFQFVQRLEDLGKAISSS
jgi:hypothetical protein